MTLLVTGSYPPDVCGVGDYCHCLMNTEKAADWKLFYKKDWSLKNYSKYKKEILALKPDKLIIQYPALGYGWSFIPFLLMKFFTKKMGRNCIPVYHEFSNKKFKARIVQDFFLFFAKQLVVTNRYEEESVKKHHKKLDVKVIKIFSNINKVDQLKKYSDREYDYVCFGQINAGKGIEDFINFVKPVSKERKCAIVGVIPRDCEEYGNTIIQSAKENNIEIFIGLESKAVSEFLNNSKFAVLPFPDGISERRGSFMAALINGCLIVSTTGRYTTEALKNVLFEEFPVEIEALEAKQKSVDNDLWKTYIEKADYFLETELPKSWDDVVGQYNSL